MKAVFKVIASALLLSAFSWVIFLNEPNSSTTTTVNVVQFTHDVVNAVPPVLASDWRTELVGKLQQACTSEERTEVMVLFGKPLAEDLEVFLLDEDDPDEITSIAYFFGDGFAEKVESGTPIAYSGFFHDELIALVTFKTGEKKQIFIKCFNGLYSIKEPEKLELVSQFSFPVVPKASRT